MPNLKFLASTVPEILLGPKIPKVGHVTPTRPLFDAILHFFRKNSPPSVSMPNLKFLASTVHEILGGPKIPKVGHVTPT